MPPTQPASVLSLQEAPSRSRIRLPSNSYNPEVLRRRRPWWARKWNPESTQPSLSSTLAARAGPMRRDNCRRHLTEAGTVCATRNAVVHTDTSRHWKSKRKRLQSFTFDVYWCKILMGDLSRDSWISFVQTLKKVSSWRPHGGTRKTEMRAGRQLRRGFPDKEFSGR